MSKGRQLPSNLKHAPIKPKVKKANVDHFPKKKSDLYPNISVKAFRKGCGKSTHCSTGEAQYL